MSEERIREYASQDIVVGFASARGIHAANGVRELPAVFDVDRRPRIDPDGAPADVITEQIARCPAGALTARELDRGARGGHPRGPLSLRRVGRQGLLRRQPHGGRVHDLSRRQFRR